MIKLELKKIYLYIDHELNHLSQNSDAEYRNAFKDDAQQFILLNKDDIDKWLNQLKERAISCYDIEMVLETKRELIKLPKLENIGLGTDELELLKGDILRLIAKSIMNTYLDSLFKKTSSTQNVDFKKGNWF